MPELVRCKPCGYVMRKDKLGRVCPACGAKAAAFEPHKDRVSARRRMILNLDLHPILVHAPQAFAALLPVLVAAAMLGPSFYAAELRAVIGFFVLVLPLGTVTAIASGLVDGKLKFKRLSPPYLVQKIVAGIGLLIVSGANAAVVLVAGLGPRTMPWVLGLAAASLACAVFLGHTGKKLILPILPGR
jgi:rubredoxin